MFTYEKLYGTTTGALCAAHKRLIDEYDARYLEIFDATGESHTTNNGAVKALYARIDSELQSELRQLLSRARNYYDEQYLHSERDYPAVDFDMIRAPYEFDWETWEVDNEFEEIEDYDEDEDEDEEKELHYRETLSRWYVQESLYNRLLQAGAKVSSNGESYCFEYCGRGGSPLAAVHRWLYR